MRAALWTVLAILTAAAPARGQSPVTMVVNFVAGGPSDITGRMLAPELGAALGTPVVVKNVPGASGTIGATEVARARPDGLTILLSPAGPIAIQPHYARALPYRVEDFAPLCQFTDTPVVMMTPQVSGLRTLADVLARARAEGGALPYASTGPGSLPHISMVALGRATGVPMLHVPYRGSGEVMLAFQQGSVAVFSDQPAVMRQHNLHAVAVFAPARAAEFPDTPTLRELGHDLSYSIWQGLFAPAGTPADMLARLEAACARAVAATSVREGFARVQMPLQHRGARAFAAFVAAESAKFRDLVLAAGLRAVE